ncbi:MAG: recombinase family protein [Candidatus Methanomethylophilaceae archaeon]|uniref:recombinase family protein n=1 Tax=Candidatus Methanarcanum hacksteinii TaxID=2911857 RepID=UPI002A770A53|nr:recombinase family protein [Candidatus Methanomethylophilaceae archaeon]MDY4580748.1 recombinase family protein [Candidatus Methanarcanum hacksteinii]
MSDRIRAALYARVSTEEQADQGYSLAAQLQMLRDFCEVFEMDIAGEYVDDGYSGTNTRRPAYRRMFSPDERQRWDALVVIKMDRIHRNSKNFMLMIEDLSKNGQSFFSTTERIDTTTAVGRFAMDVIQRIAQLESEQIGERTKFGMIQKAEQKDGIMGFQPPYGYSIADGELISIPEEQIIVKRIFGSYLENSTLDEIASELNSSFIRTRNGNQWNKYNLRNILHNPVYAGYMHWEEHLIGHHADCPVSVDEYNQVQRLMASKTRGAKKNLPILLDVEESL